MLIGPHSPGKLVGEQGGIFSLSGWSYVLSVKLCCILGIDVQADALTDMGHVPNFGLNISLNKRSCGINEYDISVATTHGNQVESRRIQAGMLDVLTPLL